MKYLFLHIPKSGGSYIDKIKKDKIVSSNIVTPEEYSDGLRWHMSFIPGSEIYKNGWGINSTNTPFKKDLYYQCYDKDRNVMPNVSINFDTLESSLQKFFKGAGCLLGDLPREKIRQGTPFKNNSLYDQSRFNLVGDKYYNSFNNIKKNSLFI